MSERLGGVINAPFSAEQVAVLNQFQRLRNFHPFTCGSGNRTDDAHLDGEGVLVAAKEGWICPYCDYRQNWAHGFMADPQALEALRRNDPRS